MTSLFLRVSYNILLPWVLAQQLISLYGALEDKRLNHTEITSLSKNTKDYLFTTIHTFGESTFQENSSASLLTIILLPTFWVHSPTTKAWLLPKTTEAVCQNIFQVKLKFISISKQQWNTKLLASVTKCSLWAVLKFLKKAREVLDSYVRTL